MKLAQAASVRADLTLEIHHDGIRLERDLPALVGAANGEDDGKHDRRGNQGQRKIDPQPIAHAEVRGSHRQGSHDERLEIDDEQNGINEVRGRNQKSKNNEHQKNTKLKSMYSQN